MKNALSVHVVGFWQVLKHEPHSCIRILQMFKAFAYLVQFVSVIN